MPAKGQRGELREYFCDDKQQYEDLISINIQPLGATIFAILDTPDNEFQQTITKLNESIKTRPNESPTDCLRRLYEYLDKGIFASFSSAYLSWLLIKLPQATIHKRLRDSYEVIAPSSHESEEIMSKYRKGILIDVDVKKYNDREGPSEVTGGLLCAWEQWESILKEPKRLGDEWLPYLSLSATCDQAKDHLRGILSAMMECIRLKKDLPVFIDNWGNKEKNRPDREIENALSQVCDVSPYPDHLDLAVTCKEPLKMFKNTKSPLESTEGTLLREMKSVNTVSALVAYEIAVIKSKHRRIKQCALCGRYFIPYTKNNKYCRRPNPDHRNKMCVAIGRQTHCRLRQICDKSAVDIDFLKHKNSYAAWIHHNIRLCNPKGEIAIEIQTNFSTWFNCADKAVKLYHEKKITEDECREKIILPKIQDRSEKLYIMRTFS